MKILGCMSGSSLDGLDMALCDFKSESTYTLIKATTFRYSDQWVTRLQKVNQLSHEESCQLEADFTTYIAANILDFLSGEETAYISSHGHTILHNPDSGYSYQLANGAYLAAKTSIPVISEYRLQDIAKGGQGAPIAPAIEKYLLPKYDAYLNLGGIANISHHSEKEITAYDIGPCNQLLNALAQQAGKQFDEGGLLAKSGMLINELLSASLAHSYFSADSPKSLDNRFVVNEFVQPFLDHAGSVTDKLHTATRLIAKTIAAESGRENHIYATGGGALNSFLMECLDEELQNQNNKLVIPDAKMIEFKEAILMALMGYLRLHDKVNVFCSVTGATSDTVAGCIYTC